MKVKILRDKDTKEFIHLYPLGDKIMVCTGDIPSVHPLSATMELVKEMYPKERVIDGDYNHFNNFELVEYDLIEAGEVGADIRNKLSPPMNLVALLEEYFSGNEEEDEKVLLDFIKKEMAETKVSVEYLAKLL